MVIPIRSGGPPPGRVLAAADWARGRTFLELVDGDAAGSELAAAFDAAEVPAEHATFFAAPPRALRVAVCGDLGDARVRRIAALVERLCTQGDALWMRVLDTRDAGDVVRRLAPGAVAGTVWFVCATVEGPIVADVACDLDAAPAAVAATLRAAVLPASG